MVAAISFTIAKKCGQNLNVNFNPRATKQRSDNDFLSVSSKFMSEEYDCFSEWACYEKSFSQTSKPLLDMNAFSEKTGNAVSQIKMLPEAMWKDIQIEDQVKTRSHPSCFLVKKGITTSGWACNKLKGLNTCYSGITGFY
jgi:hypothetical protein